MTRTRGAVDVGACSRPPTHAPDADNDEPHLYQLATARVAGHPVAAHILRRVTGRERPRLRILIVEDDATLLSQYETSLRLTGHEVRGARNGAEGLDALAWAPDVILLDLAMPVMDGHEFLARLRRLHGHRETPVLVLSGVDRPRGESLYGRITWLEKPFHLERVLRAIEDLVGRGRE